ncbi:hypothetical protein LJK88_50425 [Paenibacillus sp. P26]|nr:hypothetical protein LJK88_50425 [Paenibacillus sp. P26]UUZ91386.1 hypothetical protein LJK87_37950 [Paenibacillus sp. P25]
MASVKKTKQPGDNISLKTKKTEDPSVMNWINAQTNLMDSLRYLIENEIRQNGVRNLQAFIPMERNTLASAAPSQNGVPDGTRPGLDAEAAAVTAVAAADAVGAVAGARQLQEAKEQAAAAVAVQPDEPEPAERPQGTEGRTADWERPETPTEERDTGPSAEDEIDDDDIEAWI